VSRRRARSRFVYPPTSPRGTGNAEVDTWSLAFATALAAATGAWCKPRGTFVIRTPQAAWFYWYNGPASPVYGVIPMASGLKLDLSEATIRVEVADWMVNTTRIALFYTPGFSTTAGRVSNITVRGGTIDFTRWGVRGTPSYCYAFGLLGVDDFKMEYTRIIGANGEKQGRGGFMLNCRRPHLRNCTYKNIAQGHYMAFTDYGNASGLRFENLAEGIDFDQPCRGWIISDTFAKSLTEQVWDGGTIDHCLFHGLVASDIPNVIQLYVKPGCWQTYAEMWDHLGAVSITFDTTANTITFGSAVGGVTPNNPVIANGRHIGLNIVGTLPTGLFKETLYYLVNVSGQTAQLSLTEGGAAIDFSGSPTSNNTATFYPNDIRICEKVTISGVKVLNAAGGEIIRISNLRQGGIFYLGTSDQCRDITLYDWHCEGVGKVVINEGRNIVVDKMTLRNCTPVRDTKLGYAFVAREASSGGNSSANSYLSLKVSRLTIDGCTQGGAAVSGATELTWDDVKIVDYVGEQWTEGAATYDTRFGFVLARVGSKAGGFLSIGKTDIRGGPDNCTDFKFDDVNTPGMEYRIDFVGPFNFASSRTATGVTPCDVRVSTDDTREAVKKTVVVPFDETVDTTATTKTKHAASDLQVYRKVVTGSVKTLAAITAGSGANGSTVTLARRVAGVETNISNGFLRLDVDAGVAADAERFLPMGSNETGSTIAPGETLVAKIVAAGTGGTSPPCALNLGVIEYTSV
jgi:hypothetical protein